MSICHCGANESARVVYYRKDENHGSLKQTAKTPGYLGINGASF